jgi:16S rRNA (guanine966-N2)-methyltransferase
MRITGGEYRGRVVKCPPGVIRPAMDRMRESLFSILGNLEGKSFLDIFSGSGVVGLEAASRGAHPVHVVEKDYKKRHVLSENLQIAQPAPKMHLQPAEKFLGRCRDTFDIIYLDPPFPLGGKIQFLQKIAEKDLLKPGGLMIMHYPGEEEYPEEIGGYKKNDLRKYGRSHLIFYHRSDS